MAFSALTRREFLWRLAKAFSLWVLTSVGACAGALSYMSMWEPRAFQRSHKRLSSGLRPRLQKVSGLRILHLSDFHASWSVPYDLIEEGVDAGIAEGADLICLTGDYITSTLDDEERYVEILKKLVTHAPTVACLGNHDGGP